MRIVYNILIGVMLLGMLAAGAWRAQAQRAREAQVDQVRGELQRIQREITLRATLRDVPLSDRGYPQYVNPDWFDGHLPLNTLLEGARPWMEIANNSQIDLRHPPDPIASDENHAMFWYSPHTGRVRARVPLQPSEKAALELYNSVNGTSLRVD